MTSPTHSNHMPAYRTMLAANGAGALSAAIFAAVGLKRPHYVEPGSTPTSLGAFWAAASAVRTWSITIPLLSELLLRRRLTPQLLVAAGLVQLGDSALGVRQRNRNMILAPAAMGLTHLLSARVISRA